jgi:hypothetical protein
MKFLETFVFVFSNIKITQQHLMNGINLKSPASGRAFHLMAAA